MLKKIESTNCDSVKEKFPVINKIIKLIANVVVPHIRIIIKGVLKEESHSLFLAILCVINVPVITYMIKIRQFIDTIKLE